jgi:hypothetical protein
MTAPDHAVAAPETIAEGNVIEMACGITVYRARAKGDRWRAVWYEDGRRRHCESVRERVLAARLKPVEVRVNGGAVVVKDIEVVPGAGRSRVVADGTVDGHL